MNEKHECPKCQSTDTVKNGTVRGVQRFKCKNCNDNKDQYNNNICHFMIPLFTLHYLFSNLRISL